MNVNVDLTPFLGELFITQAKLEALLAISINNDNVNELNELVQSNYLSILLKFKEKYPNVLNNIDEQIEKFRV